MYKKTIKIKFLLIIKLSFYIIFVNDKITILTYDFANTRVITLWEDISLIFTKALKASVNKIGEVNEL
jgi:hypothetical protein